MQFLIALIVFVASVTLGALALWLIGSLSAWRYMPYESILSSVFKYLLIVGIAIVVYRFAREYVTIEPLNISEKWWRISRYLRWVLVSCIISLVYASGALYRKEMVIAVAFLKGYTALLIVGLLGTGAGVKEASVKRVPK